jgi:hypothetical protein
MEDLLDTELPIIWSAWYHPEWDRVAEAYQFGEQRHLRSGVEESTS